MLLIRLADGIGGVASEDEPESDEVASPGLCDRSGETPPGRVGDIDRGSTICWARKRDGLWGGAAKADLAPGEDANGRGVYRPGSSALVRATRAVAAFFGEWRRETAASRTLTGEVGGVARRLDDDFVARKLVAEVDGRIRAGEAPAWVGRTLTRTGAAGLANENDFFFWTTRAAGVVGSATEAGGVTTSSSSIVSAGTTVRAMSGVAEAMRGESVEESGEVDKRGERATGWTSSGWIESDVEHRRAREADETRRSVGGSTSSAIDSRWSSEGDRRSTDSWERCDLGTESTEDARDDGRGWVGDLTLARGDHAELPDGERSI